MFETKELAERAYISGCQWAFKVRSPGEKESLKTKTWRTILAMPPLTTVEDETKHWCWHWGSILESKVTFIAPKEPILIVEENTKKELSPWKVIAGEKIGWIFCTHLVGLEILI